jgi:hypothetical protein
MISRQDEEPTKDTDGSGQGKALLVVGASLAAIIFMVHLNSLHQDESAVCCIFGIKLMTSLSSLTNNAKLHNPKLHAIPAQSFMP